MRSLRKFVAQRVARKTQCKVCLLPRQVREELNQGFRDGISAAAIRDWVLEEHKVSLGRDSAQRHRRLHVKKPH